MQQFRSNPREHAVLLLHGLASSPVELRYLSRQLQREGFAVAAPHIHGLGYGAPVADWRVWRDTASYALDQLKREYQTVSVSGLCIGAVLALALAAERGRDIAALSLLSTTLYYDGWSVPWYRFLLPLGYYTPLRYLYSYREREPFGIKNELLRKRIARSMAGGLSEAGAASISMRHVYQATRMSRHVMRNLAAVDTPTLMIHAIDDDTSSIRSVDFVARNIGAGVLRRVLLSDSYHMVTMDNEKATVARETGSFFSEYSVGATARAAETQLRTRAGRTSR